MMKKTWLAIMMMALLPSGTAFAVKMTRLYQAEIPVVSQLSDVKEQAVREGFLQVLIKLSGNEQIEKNPIIRASLKRAEYYVQDLRYALETPNASEYLLQIQFEPDDINRLLKQANIAAWSDHRPLILVWLVKKDKHDAMEIVADETSGAIYKSMSNEGEKYGLPLIFPVMDVSEMNEIAPQDVASVSMNVLNAAAKRYSPDAMLIGEMTENETGMQSKWQLITPDAKWHWQIAGDTEDEVVGSIINQIKGALIAQHGVKEKPHA